MEVHKVMTRLDPNSPFSLKLVEYYHYRMLTRKPTNCLFQEKTHSTDATSSLRSAYHNEQRTGDKQENTLTQTKQKKNKIIHIYRCTKYIYKNLHKRKKLKNPLLIASTTEGMYSTSHRTEKKQNH